jgi:hypothetical protein
MPSNKQIEAAKENIKKAQRRGQEMTPWEHAISQPEGRKRAKPGTKGEATISELLYDPMRNSPRFVI